MAAEKSESPAIAGAGSMPAPTPEQVRILGLRVAELDAEIAADRREIVHWYRENVDDADGKSEEEIRSMFEQAEHKGATDIPLKRAKAYVEAFVKKSAQRKALTEALATETAAATETASVRAACELRALVPGYELLNPAARALVTGMVTDKALSVLLDDTANLRVLGEVGARVMAAAELRTAVLIRESEERMLEHLAASEARITALLTATLGGTRGGLLGSAFSARMAGARAAALRGRHGAYEMKAAGYTAAELKVAEFPAAELRAADFAASELKAAGYSAAELKAGGFTAAELKAVDFSPVELKAGGFDRGTIRSLWAQCTCHDYICDYGWGTGALKWGR